MFLNAALAITGIALVLLIVSDVFETVIVPRPSFVLRPSAYISRAGWRMAGTLGSRIADGERREAFYGFYAPALLVALMAFWIVSLDLGFGLVFFSIRDQLRPVPEAFGGALYYAGTSLLTLGYGDIVAHGALARAISLTAAGMGLGTFAIVTAFLFSLFGAFQRREAFIVTLRERTGAPPSGVVFIERHVELRMLDDLPATFRAAEGWMADIMETHLAYPILSYFRSTHDNQSWVGTIGALLDASALMITTVDLDNVGRAEMLSRLGRHLVSDYADYYELDAWRSPGIERDEFDQVRERLRAKGLRVREGDVAWSEFAELRSTYAVPLNAMARWWRIPPAQWIGDRSIIASRHVPGPTARMVPDGGLARQGSPGAWAAELPVDLPRDDEEHERERDREAGAYKG